MDLFRQEMQKEYSSLGLKDQSKNIRVLDQVGKAIVSIDKKRKALAPGKRISSNGKVYWETRRNRSDVPGKNV